MVWLISNIIKVVSLIVILTPRPLQLWVGKFLGLVWFYVIRVRRKAALENVKLAYPNLTNREQLKMVRKNFEHYGMSFIEFLMLPHFTRKDFDKLFIVEGWENYQKAMAKGKGAFIMTAHFGNWELMSATQREQGIPLHVITKRFKLKILNDLWVELRMNRGIRLIREEKSTFEILRALRGGECVGFIMDQFMGPPIGVKTVFFGVETGTQASLALFCDRTRSPVVPVYNIRQANGKIRLIFEPEIPFMEQGSTEQNISFMTQVYTSKIEEIVKQSPEQWLWIHRRWKPFRP